MAIEIHLMGGTYEAALDDGPEWPPHPGRLFSALVAQAKPGSADDTALTWLEEQTPPVVLASVAEPSTMRAFVPTNAVGKDGKGDTHQTYLGRTSGERTWHRVHPLGDTVRMVWEDAEPTPQVRARLRRLCRQIPFLGRSTSPVVVTLPEGQVEELPGAARYESPGDASVRMRVPSSLSALRDAYEAGEPSRSVDRWAPYGPARPAASVPEAVVDGPWSEFLTFGLSTGVAVDGHKIVAVGTAWRQAVLSGLGGDHTRADLALLHGHGGSGLQCAFVPLPSVGSIHADGQVRGLGLALSPDLPPAVRRSLLLLLGMDVDAPRLAAFFVPGLLDSAQPLRHGAFDGRMVTDPARWSGERGYRTWSTVSPLVPDRHVHRRDSPVDHVVAACAFAGYPEPVQVDILRAAPFQGAARLQSNDLRRRRSDSRRAALHCRITFSVPLRGPVLLGNLRHLGVGLCLPVDDDVESPLASTGDGAVS